MSNSANPKAIRETMSRMGKSCSELARELGVDRTIVEGVLSGRLQAKRGKSHKVAVALGLKEGVIIGEGMPIAEAIRKAAA